MNFAINNFNSTLKIFSHTHFAQLLIILKDKMLQKYKVKITIRISKVKATRSLYQFTVYIWVISIKAQHYYN